MATNGKGPSPPELPKVQLKYPSLDAFAKAARKTFKLGRMTLKTKKELSEGNRVGLSFAVPEREQPIEIIGEVIDVVRGAEGQPNTYGVRFLNFSEKKLVRLLELKAMAAATAPPAAEPPPSPPPEPEAAPPEPQPMPFESQAPPAPAPEEAPRPSPAEVRAPAPDEETEVFTIDTSEKSEKKVPAFFDQKAAAPSESKTPIEEEVHIIEKSDQKVPTFFDDRAAAAGETKVPIELEPPPAPTPPETVPAPGPLQPGEQETAAAPPVPAESPSEWEPSSELEAAPKTVAPPQPSPPPPLQAVSAPKPLPKPSPSTEPDLDQNEVELLVRLGSEAKTGPEEVSLPGTEASSASAPSFMHEAAPATESVEPPLPVPAEPAVSAEEPLSETAAESVAEGVPTPETVGKEARPLTPAEYEALGNFLLRFTRQVMPSGKPVPAKTLWEEFRALMGGRDELGLFLYSQPAGKDFMIEGTAPAPVSLKTVIPREMAPDLIPKLVELFDRKKLLGLIMRRYLSEGAFTEALRLLAEYGAEGASSEELVSGLLKAGAYHFGPIFVSDRVAAAEALSWRASLFLTRLAGELRRLNLFAQSLSEEPRAVLTLRVEDALKPIRDPSILAEILTHCDQAAAGQEEFNEADLQSEIVFALPLDTLVQTVEVIAGQFERAFAARQKKGQDPKVAAREQVLRKTLRRAVARLAFEAVESGMKILSRLYRKQVLVYEELPEALRDLVDAERQADEYRPDLPARLLRLGEMTKVEDYRRRSRIFVHVLIEFVRRGRMDLAEQIFRVLVGHRTDKTPPFGERPALAREAMGIFGEAASLEILVRAFQSEHKEVRERVASLLYAADEPAVPVLLDVLGQTQEPSVRKLACDVLTRLGDKLAPKLRERLLRRDTSWYLARNLIMVLGDMKSAILLPDLEPFLDHEQARVRDEALGYMMKVGAPEPEPRLVLGLADPDPVLRAHAIQYLSQLASLPESAVPTLLGMVEKRTVETPAKEDETVFVLALELLSRKKPGKLPDGRILERVVLGLWEAESAGLFKRLSGAKPKQTSRMRAALCEAMGRIGSDKCKKALKEASKDKDEQVRRAAKAALERAAEGSAKAS